MTFPIIDKLNATLEAKTTEAIANLHNLRVEIMRAIEQAEDNARNRIHAEQITLDIDTEQALAEFAGRLNEMAADAIGKAVGMVLDQVEAFAGESPRTLAPYIRDLPNPSPEGVSTLTSAEPEPVILPTPAVAIPTTEEPIAEAVPVEPEPSAVPLPVAAQVLDAPAVGILPHETEDDLAEPAAEEEQADADHAADDHAEPSEVGEDDYTGDDLPTTDDPSGLHTRTGEGKQARYHLEEWPQAGETYYRKAGRKRWQHVRYTG